MKKSLLGVCFVVGGGVFVLSLSGCGGGSMKTASPSLSQAVSATGGRAQISLRWPDAPVQTGRLVPVDANSIRVSFLDGNGAVLQTALVVRPAAGGGAVSINTFTDLPPGVLTVTAVAFPNADGTGNAQAAVAGQATIVQNQLTQVNLTMGTTIVRVEILPVIVLFTGNGTTTLNAAAYDAANNLVLTNQWKWENSDPNVISLVPNGATADITAVGTGQTTVTLTETQTGLFATKTLDVTSSPIGQ